MPFQFHKVVPLLSVLLLAGCAVNPPYTFSKDEKKATLKMVETAKVSMCKDGKFYSIDGPGNAQTVSIPAGGGSIDLGNYMSYSGYNVLYSCYPFLSFTPREGQTYVLHAYVRENKCYIEVVREDQTKETGVSSEPSVGSRMCFAVR